MVLNIPTNISDLNEKADNETDGAKRVMPDICVICLEQEYNAVFVP
jgi:E3 ubiquitin-protein ligase MUL1